MNEIEKTDRTGCIFVLSSAVGVMLCIWPASWVYDVTGDVLIFVLTYVISTALFATALTYTTLRALDGHQKKVETDLLDEPWDTPKRIKRKIPVRRKGKVDHWVDMYSGEDVERLKGK